MPKKKGIKSIFTAVKGVIWKAAPKSDNISRSERELFKNTGERSGVSPKHEFDKNPVKIINDEPTTEDLLDFNTYANKLSNILVNSKPVFSVGIFGQWGTGKTSLMRMMEEKIKSYDSNRRILLVWFDAWRHENDKYLGFIPLIKIIKVTLENSENKSKWSRVLTGVNHTFESFAKATNFNLGIDKFGNIETDLSKFIEIYRTEGSVQKDGETIYFHKHFTDFLRDTMAEARMVTDFRIIIFIDDLDRCLPEKALELLESIKNFFDIVGIQFVVGMNPNSIDNIIKVKYGEKTEVKGSDYIQKIIQLPFYIPTWKPIDISRFIEQTISTELAGSGILDGLNEQDISLITYAVESNPRQVKRFMNNIIFTRSIFGIPESRLSELIVVQAMIFRQEWNNFLDLLSRDLTKDQFITEYELLQIDQKLTLEAFKKKHLNSNPILSEMIELYPSFIMKTSQLRIFLDRGAFDVLKQIKDINKLRRYFSITTNVPESETVVLEDVFIVISMQETNKKNIELFMKNLTNISNKIKDVGESATEKNAINVHIDEISAGELILLEKNIFELSLVQAISRETFGTISIYGKSSDVLDSEIAKKYSKRFERSKITQTNRKS